MDRKELINAIADILSSICKENKRKEIELICKFLF